MNIATAKQQIKNTVKAYLRRDDAGMYVIPPLRQRPMFLVGAPGIGKTAIIEQIAQELGIGVVSYSMTHHTRQSALGLPQIVRREFEGFEVRGMGGTDFRPAFAYVNDLVDSGELADMKGLIYFTDGLGAFPEKPPDYDAAFVFLDEGDNHIPDVPPWAMRVLVDEEGINRFKSEIL
jgi:MoxR-like ATPase